MKKTFLLLTAAVVFLFTGCSKDDEPLSFDEQFALDQQKIDDYLSENGITALTDPSSQMRYVVHNEGSGSFGTLSETATVNYEGRLLSDDVFDFGEFITFDLNQLITGWQIGVPLIREGGSITLYIPSGYGFGNFESQAIPSNSVLVFDIDLIEVGITAQERLAYEVSFIDEYLTENEIVANVDSISQIRYVIHDEGTGANPIQSSDITINYEGRVLNNNSAFDTGSGVTFTLSGLIEGWKLGLPLIKEGGSITLYLPSAYGYGGQAVGAIPAHSILVFDIDLLEVN